MKFLFKDNRLLFFLLYFLIVVVFYGQTLETWFQQDEWDLLGRFAYFNSQPPLPLLRAFLTYLMPDPRFAFAPLFALFTALQVWLFGTNFTAYAIISLFLHSINSFLVYFLSLQLTGNKKVAFLAGIIFASYGIGQKAVTWIAASTNTQGATLFSLIALIFFLKYLKRGQTKNFVLTLLFLFIALWFKETAMSLFLVLPGIYIIFKYKSGLDIFSKKPFIFFGTFYSFYFILRYSLIYLGNKLNQPTYHYDLPRFLTIPEYTSLILWSPLRAIVDIFIAPATLYSAAYTITPFLNNNLVNQTTSFGSFAENVGVDVVTGIIFLLLSFTIWFTYTKSSRANKKLILIYLIIILSSVIPSLLLTVRGTDALIHIFRSRDLYLSTIGSSILLSTFFFILWQKVKLKYWKVFISLMLALFFFYQWQYINVSVLKEEKLKAAQRQKIINGIYNKYPILPQKAVIYTESDTPYYGHSRPGMPFQSGFGRTLLTWYSLNNQNRPLEFVKSDFLYSPNSEGYLEFNGYGFGYFVSYEKLRSVVKNNSLPANSIYAWSYSGNSNTLVDISEKVRNRIFQNP